MSFIEGAVVTHQTQREMIAISRQIRTTLTHNFDKSAQMLNSVASLFDRVGHKLTSPLRAEEAFTTARIVVRAVESEIPPTHPARSVCTRIKTLVDEFLPGSS